MQNQINFRSHPSDIRRRVTANEVLLQASARIVSEEAREPSWPIFSRLSTGMAQM
jgi:hypothetical protein